MANNDDNYDIIKNKYYNFERERERGGRRQKGRK